MPLRRRTCCRPERGTPNPAGFRLRGIEMGKREDKTDRNGHKEGGGCRVYGGPSRSGAKHSGGDDKGEGGKGKGK